MLQSSGVLWLAASLSLTLVASCHRHEACFDGCQRYGIDRDSPQCQDLCTKDCEELNTKYGMGIEHCKAMQRGE